MLVRHFSSVVFILAGSMGDGWEDLSVSGRIASKFVGHELPRRPPLLFQHLAKEALSGSLVAACDQDVEHIAVLVYCSPKIMMFATVRDEHFIHVPDVTEPTLPLPRVRAYSAKFPAPGSNGFVGYLDATLSKKVLDVSKAQREPMAQPNSVAGDFRRKAVASIHRFHESIVADPVNLTMPVLAKPRQLPAAEFRPESCSFSETGKEIREANLEAGV